MTCAESKGRTAHLNQYLWNTGVLNRYQMGTTKHTSVVHPHDTYCFLFSVWGYSKEKERKGKQQWALVVVHKMQKLLCERCLERFLDISVSSFIFYFCFENDFLTKNFCLSVRLEKSKTCVRYHVHNKFTDNHLEGMNAYIPQKYRYFINIKSQV